MKTIKCPKCGKEISVDIPHSISEDGELFRCNNCNWPFRYTEHE